MDRRDKRFIRILEEMKENISDMFSETLDSFEKEFDEGNFKDLAIGMTVTDDLGISGVIEKIDGPHAVTVQYQGRKKVHCMDNSCFHYDPIHARKM
jgi:hypothetical protein